MEGRDGLWWLGSSTRSLARLGFAQSAGAGGVAVGHTTVGAIGEGEGALGQRDDVAAVVGKGGDFLGFGGWFGHRVSSRGRGGRVPTVGTGTPRGYGVKWRCQVLGSSVVSSSRFLKRASTGLKRRWASNNSSCRCWAISSPTSCKPRLALKRA